MMRKNYISIVFIIVSTLLFFGRSSALVDVPWTEVKPNPEYIVIGTIILVDHDCFETPGFPITRGEQFFVHDCGLIKVEYLLFGEPDIERLPISWLSNIIGPGNLRGQQSKHEGCREYNAGVRRIWILWNRHHCEGPIAEYYGAYEMPLDSLQSVRNEISRIRSK